MQLRSMRRATTAAATILILSSIAAYADTIPADGDAVTTGNQTIVALPDAAPGQVVTVPVTFRLTCSGSNHAAPGATIAIELLSVTVPGDGAASATSTTSGPSPTTGRRAASVPVAGAGPPVERSEHGQPHDADHPRGRPGVQPDVVAHGLDRPDRRQRRHVPRQRRRRTPRRCSTSRPTRQPRRRRRRARR